MDGGEIPGWGEKENMLRRRLRGKQSSLDFLVPASRVVQEQVRQVGAAGSPYLEAIVKDAGESLEAAWWDVDYVVLPPLLQSVRFFLQIFGFVRGEGSEFPPGLEVASFPYVLTAIPGKDCKAWAASTLNLPYFSGFMKILSPFLSFFDFVGGCFFLEVMQPLQELMWCLSLNASSSGATQRPPERAPRGPAQQTTFISTPVALVEAVQEAHPITLYLCLYGCKFPAKGFWNRGSLVRLLFGGSQKHATMKAASTGTKS